jgi:hypothetical protein
MEAHVARLFRAGTLQALTLRGAEFLPKTPDGSLWQFLRLVDPSEISARQRLALEKEGTWIERMLN